MAKPNYQFEKRQRDLAKKRKQEEKQRQKLANKAAAEAAGQDASANPSEATPPDAEGTTATPTDSGTKPKG